MSGCTGPEPALADSDRRPRRKHADSRTVQQGAGALQSISHPPAKPLARSRICRHCSAASVQVLHREGRCLRDAAGCAASSIASSNAARRHPPRGSMAAACPAEPTSVAAASPPLRQTVGCWHEPLRLRHFAAGSRSRWQLAANQAVARRSWAIVSKAASRQAGSSGRESKSSILWPDMQLRPPPWMA